MLCAWCQVISRVLPPFLHVCRVVVFQWVLLRMQVPLVVPAHLFFFHLSLVLKPMTRNLFGSSFCARFWKGRLRNLLCALCLLARLRLTRMFLVFPCQALRHVCRVPMERNVPSSSDVSWPEARWLWYQSYPSEPPDLRWFGSTASPRPTSVFSRFDPGGFRPRLFCRLLYQGCCYRGATCTFAHFGDELHSDAGSSQVELALEVDADGTF